MQPGSVLTLPHLPGAPTLQGRQQRPAGSPQHRLCAPLPMQSLGSELGSQLSDKDVRQAGRARARGNLQEAKGGFGGHAPGGPLSLCPLHSPASRATDTQGWLAEFGDKGQRRGVWGLEKAPTHLSSRLTLRARADQLQASSPLAHHGPRKQRTTVAPQHSRPLGTGGAQYAAGEKPCTRPRTHTPTVRTPPGPSMCTPEQVIVLTG